MAANVSRRSLKRKLFPVALYCPSFSSVARIEKKKAVSSSSPPQRVFRTVRIPNCMPHAPMVNVTVTNDGLQAMEWVRKHLKEGKGNRAVGFDVEWRPSFKAKEYNKVALVQLATDTEVLLLQLSHSCDPIASHEALRPVLSSKDIIKVGVGVALDLKRLSADYNFDTFDGYCDVGAVARRVMGTGGLGGNTLGLASAYAQCFGVEVPKVRAVQMSNWEAVKLSQAQIQYAAWDALMGLQVYGHQRAVENAFGEGSYAKQVKHCLSLLSSRPPTRSDYKSILRICSESSDMLRRVSEELDSQRQHILDQLLCIPGTTYRTLLQAYALMLNWTVTRHTVLPPGSTLFRVDIEVDGRLLATGQGNNKADATEEASKTAFLELHGLEMLIPFEQFVLSFGGVLFCPPIEFIQYIHTKSRFSSKVPR